MKIDFHVHITPPEISGNVSRYAGNEPYFARLAENPKNRFASAEEVIRELDAAGFDQAVVFGFGFRDLGLCRLVNDYVIAKVREFPKRLIGYMAIPPKHPEAEREIDRCYRAGLRGAGEIFPAGQDFRIDEAEDTRVFAEACIERNLPVLIHANEPVGHYYPGKTDTPLHSLERFIEQYPDLTVILAHWGGGLLFYELMPEMREKCRKVYYDTAASVFLYDAKIYRTLCALGLGEKILFGSDFPLIPISRYLKDLDASGVSEEAKTRILGGNGNTLLLPLSYNR
ncbi:MAG: amidohydrolase family protein [Spirochaetaceae bacterium]|jgi:predicted TIM-barrel fold metal-dependent hydrolase|nr:amidohydrolase family protein [Spirochaetaceae bacterium]